MKKSYNVKVYKVKELAVINITTCETHTQAQETATHMAIEGILDFKKSDINYISISFDKEKQ